MPLPQVSLVPQKVQTLQRLQFSPLSHTRVQSHRHPLLPILNRSSIAHTGHHLCLPCPTPDQTRTPQRLSGLKSLLPIPLSSTAVYVPQVPQVRPLLEAQLCHPPPLSRAQTLLQRGILPLPRLINEPHVGHRLLLFLPFHP